MLEGMTAVYAFAKLWPRHKKETITMNTEVLKRPARAQNTLLQPVNGTDKYHTGCLLRSTMPNQHSALIQHSESKETTSVNKY